MCVYFTLAHTNACNFLTNLSVYKCSVRNIVWSFGMYCGKFCAVIVNNNIFTESHRYCYVQALDYTYTSSCSNTYAEIPGHMIVLLELIQNNRFVWGNRCYVIIGLMAQILSY